MWPLAGKTGTVDEKHRRVVHRLRSDITVGVWISNDDKRKSLGTAEQGSLAALPMWMEFMQAYIDGREDKDDPRDFQAPGNIRLSSGRSEDRRAGSAATPAPSTKRSSPAHNQAASPDDH
jgi:membrane carboxypeptidase/penicillin-binding protein